MRRRRAFTLVELLVVIAILAILAGLLFPVFAQAKGAAKKTVCLSNLKSVGYALGLYLNDSDDVFPNALDASDKFAPEIWDHEPEFQARIPTMPLLVDVLEPYTKSKDIWHCPSDSGTRTLESNFPVKFTASPSMYKTFGNSYFFRTEIAFKAFTSTRFRLPAETNVFFDGAGHWHGDGRALQPDDDMTAFARLTQHYRYNTLYGDLHAKNLSYNALQQLWAMEL